MISPTQYNKLMSTNPLWKLMNSGSFRREREIEREVEDDDDYETHCKRETLTHRELI